MATIISNAWAWILDYLFVGRVFASGLFLRNGALQYTRPRNPDGFNATEIVLIPGVYEDWRFMKRIADVLYEAGYKIHILEGLGHNRGSVESMAKLATDYARVNIPGDYVLVAHSKGGLIGKYMLIDPERSHHLKGLIALNTPFSGSIYAYLLPPVPSLVIFKPHSKIIKRLASNTAVNKDIVSIFGVFDPHIPGGSHLQGAHNIQLNTKGHFKILNDRMVMNQIIEALRLFDTLSV